jgi:hypothetical protein
MRELTKFGGVRRHLLPSCANTKLAAIGMLSALPAARLEDVVNLCTPSAATTRASAKQRTRGERMVNIAAPHAVGARASASSDRQARIGESVRNNRLHSSALRTFDPGAR